MTKKKYEIPQMDIVLIHADTPLLSGSVMMPGADNETPGAPDFGMPDLQDFSNPLEVQKLLMQ